MQPYFFPYIGYFQLIAAVDLFIVYDNIKFTKKGWINRNRMLENGKDIKFSLPLKRDSDSLDIRDRELSGGFESDKLLRKIEGAYRRAPCFEQTFRLIECIMRFEDRNLFRFLHHSIASTCKHMAITTEIRISSDIAIDHRLKNQDKVLALCRAVGATSYVNPIGGIDLYAREEFRDKNIDLNFIQSKSMPYVQFNKEFVPWLSIIDVLMFNSLEMVRTFVSPQAYELI